MLTDERRAAIRKEAKASIRRKARTEEYRELTAPATILALLDALDRMEKRERHFAQALGVPDGGQYRNDWEPAIRRVLEERDTLRAKLEQAEAKLEWGKVVPTSAYDEMQERAEAAEARAAQLHENLRKANDAANDELTRMARKCDAAEARVKELEK